MNTLLVPKYKFNRVFANILSIFVILAFAFSMTGSASAEESAPFTGRDDFDGALAEGWYWINENPDKWSLSENPGFLRINVSPYEVEGPQANKLLRNVTQHDFAIETHVFFRAASQLPICRVNHFPG